jgi:hypothetical protein
MMKMMIATADHVLAQERECMTDLVAPPAEVAVMTKDSVEISGEHSINDIHPDFKKGSDLFPKTKIKRTPFQQTNELINDNS